MNRGIFLDYITVLEYIGVLAFAVSGAIVAIEEEFDVFGIYNSYNYSYGWRSA